MMATFIQDEQSVSAEILQTNKPNTRPEYMCWRPTSPYVLSPPPWTDDDDDDDDIFGISLSSDDEIFHVYKKFDNIVRTVHFEDYMKIVDHEEMKSRTLTPVSHSILSETSPPLKGLWFGPFNEKDDDGRNNWYGNVSFQINFNDFLKSLGNVNIYFIEVVEFRWSCCSRILISCKEHNLPLYDPSVEGGPWHRNSSGQDMYLTTSKTFDNIQMNNRKLKNHELEFYCDIDGISFHQLKKLGKIIPVNHSEANSGKFRKCRKHNSGMIWSTCPTPWPANITELAMKQLDELQD